MKSPKLPIMWIVLCTLSLAIHAQTNPDLEQGIKPYGSYHGGSLDQVSLSNGNLFFQAPLFSYAQRGALSYPLVLQYNNKNFSSYQVSPPPGCPHCLPQIFVVFGGAPGGRNSYGASVTVGYEGIPGLSTSRVDTGLTYFGQPIFVNLTSVKPPDGSLHELVSGDGSSLVTDGSGYRGDSYIRDSSGTKYSVNGFAEDPNGNQVSVSSPSSIWTDTLGRQIPAAPGAASPAAN